MSSESQEATRAVKALEVTGDSRITFKNGVWSVPSQTRPSVRYEVNPSQTSPSCTCKDFELRGKPDGIDSASGAFRWGVGGAFPSRSPLRGLVELNGFVPNSDTVTLTGASITGVDGSVPPTVSST